MIDSLEHIVLVGAGRLGWKVANAMRRHGVPPLAFVDRNTSIERVADVPCMTLDSALERFPEARFVVSIWGAASSHRICDTEQMLRERGVKTLPFSDVLRFCRTSHYWIDEMGDVSVSNSLRAVRLFAGASQQEYVAQAIARIHARPDLLGGPCPGPAYFADDLVRWRDDERVIDGGAFDGDTLRAWVRHRGTFALWQGIEPDAISFQRFAARLADVPAEMQERVTCRRAALWSSTTTLRVVSMGGNDTVVGEHVDGEPVDTVTLNDLSGTVVKLDVEGAEPEVLEGGWSMIDRDRPVLAISVYHKLDHLWRIPLMLQGHLKDYTYHLRQHGAEGWDVVCYAIPNERCI